MIVVFIEDLKRCLRPVGCGYEFGAQSAFYELPLGVDLFCRNFIFIARKLLELLEENWSDREVGRLDIVIIGDRPDDFVIGKALHASVNEIEGKRENRACDLF